MTADRAGRPGKRFNNRDLAAIGLWNDGFSAAAIAVRLDYADANRVSDGIIRAARNAGLITRSTRAYRRLHPGGAARACLRCRAAFETDQNFRLCADCREAPELGGLDEHALGWR